MKVILPFCTMKLLKCREEGGKFMAVTVERMLSGYYTVQFGRQ
jgi:hypothetical protein